MIGFLCGFCLTNTLEICLLFRAQYSFYIEYIISSVIFSFLAQYFNVNIYNQMLSFVGAFMLMRSVVIFLYNDQIAEIK